MRRRARSSGWSEYLALKPEETRVPRVQIPPGSHFIIMETLASYLEEIKESNTLVIVEGSNDRKALEQYKITNILLASSKPVFKLIEEIPERTKEVVILTDLDKEGKKLYSQIKHQCLKRGIKVNDKVRNYLFKESEITQIEGLQS